MRFLLTLDASRHSGWAGEQEILSTDCARHDEARACAGHSASSSSKRPLYVLVLHSSSPFFPNADSGKQGCEGRVRFRSSGAKDKADSPPVTALGPASRRRGRADAVCVPLYLTRGRSACAVIEEFRILWPVR